MPKPKRLTEKYPLQTAVQIKLGDDWFAGIIVQQQHPAVWVQTLDGRRWFVTNDRHIRKPMKESTAAKLREINRQFYDSLAEPFVQTRRRPHDGFFALMPHLPSPKVTVLDVGCGNGRFGHFIETQARLLAYVGVDFSSGLLAHAVEFSSQATFRKADMSQPGFLDGLPQFDVVSIMAAIHHLPGRQNRVRLLKEMKAHLAVDGRLIVSAWQPVDSERQRRKIRDWSEVGLSADDVDANDYLMTWNQGGFAYRYISIINEKEMAWLADQAHLNIRHQFRMDGKEGNLTIYTVLSH